MTLLDYARINGAHVTPVPGSTAVYIYSPGDWHLFHLTDYAVASAVSGPGYYLTPRRGL